MKTYNMKIKELNNLVIPTDYDRGWKDGKINQLNSDRKEAIEEVKELRDIDTIDAEKVEVFEEVRRRDAIIDYLKTEWNITEGELR